MSVKITTISIIGYSLSTSI